MNPSSAASPASPEALPTAARTSQPPVSDPAQWLVTNWQVPAAGLSLLVIATLDLGRRSDFPIAAFYVAPVLLALWSQNHQHALYAAYAASGLSVIGFMRNPLGGPLAEEMTNRILSIAMIWLAAALSLQRWRRASALERAYSEMERRVQERTDELTKANTSLQSEIADRKEKEELLRQLSGHLMHAQDQERRRIARELHDNSGQTLAAIAVNLSRIENLVPDAPPKVLNLVADTAAMAEQTSREIRTISYLMHPPLLDEAGLLAAINWLANGFTQRSGIRVGVETPEEFARLPGDIEVTIFRIVQETLTNVARHSGSPTAFIKLTRQPGEVVLTVRDEGKGIPPEKLEKVQGNFSSLGVGVAGVWERVRQFGGELEINSNSRGTTVMVVVPLPEEQI
ncbi:MAG: sensor histidine kinase [Verrucomicrobia bacterium]|nr:sensor histidine kinase [Verrucomicrobiota bacterium]MBM3870856.1 sensor histidine kinase [Verrucomicrobiota bacterium]